MTGSGAIRVAIVSDTHGFLDERIARLVVGADIAVHAGDIGEPAVLDELRPRAGRVIAVTGNNDRAEDRFAGLGESVRIDLPGGSIAVEHGHRAYGREGYAARLRARHPHARAIVYGHTHRLGCDTSRRPWVLNPGAAGRVRTFGGPSCLMLHAGPLRWRIREFRFPPRR
jgi:uncharacterized protein